MVRFQYRLATEKLSKQGVFSPKTRNSSPTGTSIRKTDTWYSTPLEPRNCRFNRAKSVPPGTDAKTFAGNASALGPLKMRPSACNSGMKAGQQLTRCPASASASQLAQTTSGQTTRRSVRQPRGRTANGGLTNAIALTSLPPINRHLIQFDGQLPVVTALLEMHRAICRDPLPKTRPQIDQRNEQTWKFEKKSGTGIRPPKPRLTTPYGVYAIY